MAATEHMDVEMCMWRDPKHVKLPRPLQVGDKVTLRGTGAPATINLQVGPKMSHGIVLHFNPRRGEQCVVRNSFEAAGGWGREELFGGYPFHLDHDHWAYELLMRAGGDVLITADGHFFSTFSFRDGREAGDVACLDVQASHRCHVGRSRDVVLTLSSELESAAPHAEALVQSSVTPPAKPSVNQEVMSSGPIPTQGDAASTAAMPELSKCLSAGSFDLAELPLPDDLPDVERATFKDRVKDEDPSDWRRLSRQDVLHRLYYLGIKELSHRLKIVKAWEWVSVHIIQDSGAASGARACDDGAVPTSPRTAKPPTLAALEHSPVFEAGPGSLHPTPRIPGVDTPRSDPKRTRGIVMRELLLPAAATRYEHRQGKIGVRWSGEAPIVSRWTRNLGECGGDNCSCNRLSAPWVRTGFRNLVVSRTVKQLRRAGSKTTPPPVRYVSVGCGHLLTDFEILCGLELKGLRVESIVLCDTAYKDCIAVSPHGTVSGTDYASALQVIADFFPSAHVAAFGAIAKMEAAAKAEPKRYGGATTFVKADAEDVKTDVANEAGKVMLAKGGLAFHLANDGHDTKKDPWQWKYLGEQRAALELNRRDSFPELTHPTRRCFRCEDASAYRVSDGSPPRKILTALNLGVREGGAPLCNARELAGLFPAEELRVYRVVARQAPVHLGDTHAPSARAIVVDCRNEGDEVLAYAPFVPREQQVGTWVRLSRHDPKRMPYVKLPPNTRDQMKTHGFGGTFSNDPHDPDAEHWMLVDGSALGVGLLLMELPLDVVRANAAESGFLDRCEEVLEDNAASYTPCPTGS